MLLGALVPEVLLVAAGAVLAAAFTLGQSAPADVLAVEVVPLELVPLEFPEEPIAVPAATAGAADTHFKGAQF